MPDLLCLFWLREFANFGDLPSIIKWLANRMRNTHIPTHGTYEVTPGLVQGLSLKGFCSVAG
jgi:hypothetical protein